MTSSSPAGPALQSPLGHLNGARPPAPAWFDWALAQAPERTALAVDGVEIEVLAWGRRGDPGLLMLHGFAAHADWWSFVAPFLAQEGRRVVAISLSGMGGSGWRESYSVTQHSREAMAAAEATGLFDSAERPLVAGHSYGSYVALRAMGAGPDRWAGAIGIDSPLSADPRNRRRNLGMSGLHRIYPTEAAALARFRFAPLQPCDNLYVVDHIARWSMKAVQGEDASGWTWRFDPWLRARTYDGDRSGLLDDLRRPVALVMGGRSKLMTPERIAFIREALPAAPWVDIPDAGHHLMADQPLAFIAGLRGLLSAWPSAADKAR